MDPFHMIPSLERAARETYSAQLPLLIAMYGVPVRHKRQLSRPESNVYGQFAGVPEKGKLVDLGTQKVLMSTSQWRAISTGEVGYLDDLGYMYVNFELFDGDVLEIIRDDMKPLSFRAVSTQSLGMTTTILRRFTMSNLGGD